jgi:L-asparaginase type I
MGGNVGLFATKDRRGTYVLEPVKLSEIRRLILGDPDGTSVTLREGGIAGVTVPVHFTDLRKTRLTYSDPEELDSAQVDPNLWADLADTIHSIHLRYEGFVILHGLDTMAYTASGLSFMLRNLQVPVILTGSQRPLNYPRTDAVQNVFSAITLAASESLGIAPVVPEVCVYSYDTLFRGSRVSMVDASSYRAFDSPNFPALASVGEHIDIQQHLIPERSGTQMLNLRKGVTAKVTILDVFPGMAAGIILSLAGDEYRGVLLRTYGMGTAPTSKPVLDALDSLTKAGKVVMNVTQARSGRISTNEDPVSLRLFEQGVISGVDMTSEAAYAKMVIHLSENADSETVADLLQIAECGEQSISVFNIHYQPGQTKESVDSDNCTAWLKNPKPVVGVHLLNAESIKNIKYIQLRLLGVEPVEKKKGTTPSRTIDFEALLADPAAESSAGIHSLKTDTLRWSSKTRPTINIAYDITSHKNRLMSPNQIPSTILVLETNEPIRWKQLSILIYVSRLGEGKS